MKRERCGFEKGWVKKGTNVEGESTLQSVGTIDDNDLLYFLDRKYNDYSFSLPYHNKKKIIK